MIIFIYPIPVACDRYLAKQISTFPIIPFSTRARIQSPLGAGELHGGGIFSGRPWRILAATPEKHCQTTGWHWQHPSHVQQPRRSRAYSPPNHGWTDIHYNHHTQNSRTIIALFQWQKEWMICPPIPFAELQTWLSLQLVTHVVLSKEHTWLFTYTIFLWWNMGCKCHSDIHKGDWGRTLRAKCARVAKWLRSLSSMDFQWELGSYIA